MTNATAAAVQTQSTVCEGQFSSAPVVQIRPGASVASCLTFSACLLRSVQAAAEEGINNGGMDANLCFLIKSSLDTLVALNDAIEVKLGRAA